MGHSSVLGGEERRLLFSLNVICEAQEHYDCSLEEVVNRLIDERTSAETLRFLVTEMLNDESLDSHEKGKTYTEKEVGRLIRLENLLDVTRAVFKAYGLTLPKPDEYSSPNGESGQSE